MTGQTVVIYKRQRKAKSRVKTAFRFFSNFWESSRFKRPVLLSLLFLFSLNFTFPGADSETLFKKEKSSGWQNSLQLKGQLSLSGAWALYPLVARWAEEFQKINPRVKIDLQAGGAGKGMADVLSGLVDIALVSREVYAEEINRGAIPVAVARDAVVVTLNQKNPFLKFIQQKGLQKKLLCQVWVEGRIKTWEELIGQKGKTPIHLYTRSDACGAAETWAAFLGAHQEDLKGIAIYGDPGLVEAVRRDPLALGFNNLNFAFNPRTGQLHPGLAIGPLDLNDDGQLSAEENFYQTREKIKRAIATGVYPSPPARDLYLVITRPLHNKLTATFILWCLEQGQSLVEEVGYVTLSNEILQKEKTKIFAELSEAQRGTKAR
ncbi:MAG: PstS family phosphate ABC transporter substrate-binding protein [Candidatus Aminicenantes bacterium]|nr:PstS family phosphate ABC transporter substrate-binding protein [Candidatus Aminicenantes bacterium]